LPGRRQKPDDHSTVGKVPSDDLDASHDLQVRDYSWEGNSATTPKSVVENVSEVRPDTGRCLLLFIEAQLHAGLRGGGRTIVCPENLRSFLFDAVAEFWIGFHTPPISEERIIERTVIPGQGHFPFHPMQSLCQGAMVCVRHLMGIRLAVATVS